jgi:hypothetical protein
MKYFIFLVSSVIITAFFVSPSRGEGGRHFTYTYESPVEEKGERELEVWNTIRHKRKDFFRRNDMRMEYELGLGGNVETALYLNFSSASFAEDGAMESEKSIGFSNEWRYTPLDRLKDPIGLGLYAEGSFNSSEIELEGKIILDKKMDNFLLAFNAVGEHAYVSGVDEEGTSLTQTEEVMELVGGVAYFISDDFTIGLEARENIKRPPGFEDGGTFYAFFLGPAVSVSGDGWWAALSVMPQINGSNASKNPIVEGAQYELKEHERLEARLLFGFELGKGEEEEGEEGK